MATAALTGSSHLGVTDNQKRWLVAGIALNKILIPQIRPFVEQGTNTEYNNLKTSHNIHGQSTSGRLQRWPARKLLKYENINGNDAHPRLPGGRFNYSLFDCGVTSHVDFARLYVENYMAKFTAFDDHCDASAVLSLLSGVPVFSAAVQTAASDVRMARNDWAHCVFSKWDEAKFQQSFIEMEHLVKVMALPAADERRLLGELNDWETKGTHLCMNSPIDPALLLLVQQELKSLEDVVNNMSVEFEEEKTSVQRELQNVAIILEEMEHRVQRLETGQQNLECRTEQVESRIGNVNQRMEKFEISQQSTESRTVLVEERVDHLQEQIDGQAKSKESSATMSCEDGPKPAVFPKNFVDLIKRDYKGAVLCPFPWCEDELQLELSEIFTRLKIVGKKKERARLTEEIVHMTDTFKSHEECEKPRVVLIEGQPGMGKTTYCQKLAYDWSVEDISPEASFPKVEMLLVLKCRDMTTANIEEAIDDQLLPLDVGKREKENFFHFIRCNQSKILLVLDGLDEMSDDLLKCILPLIQGKVFPYTHLLLTARHEAGLKVRRYCDTLLEIVGYTDKDADRYIKKYFKSHEDPRLSTKLLKKLNRNRQLRELASNPLNTALLCLVCEDTRGIFPSNRTKLYDELVSCVLRRYFAKTGGSLDNNDPIKACEIQLNQLGKMALEALLKDQLAFSAEELTGHSTEFLKFGFLSREASASKIRPKPNYAFTHKTFQEYFAAFHLAHELLTGDRDKATLLSQLSPVDKFWQVWEFLFSMVASTSDDDDDATNLLVSSLCASFYHKRTGLNLSSAGAEYYDKPFDDYLYDSDGWNYEDYGDFDDYYNYDDYDCDNDYDEDDYHFYNSDEMDTRANICEDSSYDWDSRSKVELEGTLMELSFLTKTLSLICDCEQGETQLSDNQKKMVASLAHCFPVYQLKVEGASRYAAVLSEYMKANNNLTELVWCDKLDELALATIEHVLQPGHNLVHLHLQLRRKLRSTSIIPALQENRTLTHLNLSGASIGIPGAKALGNVLQSNCTLTHLSLPGNKIGHIGAEALAKGLQSNDVLVHLNIEGNWIGDQGAVALSQALKSNQTLTYLNVADNPFRVSFLESDFDHLDGVIGDSGITAIAHSLRSNCSLTYLDLRGNNFSNSAVTVLGESLQSNCTLTHLYLGNYFFMSGTDFGNSAAAAFAKALQSRCTQLTRLNLYNASVSSSSATILAEALHSNNTLTRLDLCGNKITFSGAAALAKALNVNRTLTHLDLSDNDIGDSGAKEFVETLKSNKTLVFLHLRYNSISKSVKQIFQHINPPTGCKLEW